MNCKTTHRFVSALTTVVIAALLSIPVHLSNPRIALAQANELACGYGRLQGRVIGADTSVGLPNAQVLVSSQDGADAIWGGTTDAEGNYWIDIPAPNQPRPVAGFALSFATPRRYMMSESSPVKTVFSGTVTTLDFALDPGATIVGAVRSAESGLPLTETNVIALRYVEDFGYSQTQSVEVDASGVFTLGALPTGTYILRYEPASVNLEHMITYSGGAYNPDTATTFEVTEPETIDAGLQEIGIGAMLEGVVRRADTNATLSGAIIDLYSRTEGNRLIARGSTTVAGKYLLIGLPPGEYIARVDANPLTSSGQADLVARYYGDVAASADAQVIQVQAANLGSYENRLQNLDVTLPVGGRITGVVRDAANNEPIEDIRVSALISTSLGVSAFVNDVQTDATGVYTLTGIEAGAVQVTFSGGFDYVSQQYDGVEVSRGKQLSEQAPQLIPVTLGEVVTGIDAKLNPTARISGRVTDPQGEPIAGINVTASQVDEPDVYGFGFTNSNGEYNAIVPAGAYEVRFDRNIICGCYNRDYYNSQGDLSTPEAVTVAGGAAITGIDVQLGCGTAPATEPTGNRELYLPFATTN